MKNNLFVLLFIIAALSAHAQTVSISCGSANCQSVDPGNSYYYQGTANYDATQFGAPEYNFTVNPPSVGTVIFSGSPSAIIFNNVINSPAVKVHLDAKFTKLSDQSKITVSADLPVTIKYIAPITQMTINGVNVGNGGSVQVACGNQSLSLSTPALATDPSTSVVYSWSTSWGGTLGTSSNSANTTSDVGTTDGIITVTARRSDGSFTQTFKASISRPRVKDVSINNYSANPICAGESVQLSNSDPNATKFCWTSDGGVTFNYPTAGCTYNYPIQQIGATGNGHIMLTTDNACQSPKQSPNYPVYGGVRTSFAYTDVVIDGHYDNGYNYIHNNATAYINPSGAACETFKWEVISGSGYIYPGQAYCGNTFQDINQNNATVAADNNNNTYLSTSGFMRLWVISVNRCGGGATHTFYIQNQGYSFYRMKSPNPATSAVAVELDKDLPLDMLKSVRLVGDAKLTASRSFDAATDQSKAALAKSRLISFDVGALPRGKYYLLLSFEGGKNFDEQIILD